MKALSSLIFLVLFAGCATKIEYKEVLVPSPCTVEMPRLKRADGIVNRVKEALIYSDKLEAALRFCRGENK